MEGDWEAIIAVLQEDVDHLQKACVSLTDNNKKSIKESNGIITKELQIDHDGTKVINELKSTIEEKQNTIACLERDNEALKSEIALLKGNKSNGIHINGTYAIKQNETDALKKWEREKHALIETNQIMETKIKGLVDELQKYQDKDKEIYDLILKEKEKKDFLSKLDEFDFLFRRDAFTYRSPDLQPIDKLTKILDTVKATMFHYFHFVVLAIKYDSIQAGNSKFCNLDATELYDYALLTSTHHLDWPVFILAKLSNKPPPARRSILPGSSSSGYFSPPQKHVTFSKELTSHSPPHI